MENLKQEGYFLISIKNKVIDLLLWSKDKSFLEDLTPARMIAPYFKRGKEEYLKINSKLVRIG